MGRISLIFGAVAFILFLTSKIEVEACSCQPMHPQDMFCRSDFVIKALVNTGRLVELYTDGRYKRIHEHHEEKEKVEEESDEDSSGISEESEEIGPEIGDDQLLKRHGVIRPAPLKANPQLLGPDSRMPGYHSGPAALRNEVVHPPGYVTSGDVRHRRSASSRRHGRTHYSRDVAPGRLVELVVATPEKKLMVQYRINIIKVFKGLDNFTNSRLFVYTPPPPLCTVKFATDHSPFILMGTVLDGALVIRGCDYKVELLKLSQEERSNVVRNMEQRYPKECQRCRVDMCNFGGCTQAGQPFTCAWKEWWSANSPWASQFACIQGKHGKCKWYYPLQQDIKPEDIDEWSR